MISKIIQFILSLFGLGKPKIPSSLSSKKTELENKLDDIEKEKRSTKENIDYLNKR